MVVINDNILKASQVFFFHQLRVLNTVIIKMFLFLNLLPRKNAENEAFHVHLTTVSPFSVSPLVSFQVDWHRFSLKFDLHWLDGFFFSLVLQGAARLPLRVHLGSMIQKESWNWDPKINLHHQPSLRPRMIGNLLSYLRE